MTEKKEPVKKVSPRRRARECAVQALYSWALSGNAPEQVELTFVVDQDLKGVDKPYFSRLFRQTFCFQLNDVLLMEVHTHLVHER
jgi:transcription antitermination protein NusB